MKKTFKIFGVLILIIALVSSSVFASNISNEDLTKSAEALDQLINLMVESPDGINEYDLSSAYKYSCVSFENFKNGTVPEPHYMYIPILSNSDERGAAYINFEVDSAEVMYYDLGMETSCLVPTKENLALILGDAVSDYLVIRIDDLSTIVVSYVAEDGIEYIIPFDSTGNYDFSMRTKYTKNDFISIIENTATTSSYEDGLLYGSAREVNNGINYQAIIIGIIIVALVANELYSFKKQTSK